VETVDQRIHFREGVIERQRRANGGLDSEVPERGHGAMVSGPHGDAEEKTSGSWWMWEIAVCLAIA